MKTKIKNFPDMGRGLVANKNFRKGEIVESSQVVILDMDDHKALVDTVLNLYVFAWEANDAVIALGNGSLFNHSKSHNVTYKNDYKKNKVIFKAIRSIKKGEQLFINYGYDPIIYYNTYLQKKELIKENRK